MISNEEANRIHQLCQAQGVDFELDEVEKLEGERLLVRLKGIVKDDGVVVVNRDTLKPEDIPKAGLKAQLKVPLIDESVYELENEKGSLMERTIQEKQRIPKFDHVEYPEDGGIYLYLTGWNGVPFKYPKKGWPQPDSVSANNLAKRVLISQLRMLVKNPLSAVPLLRTKNLQNWINEYNSINASIMSPFYLKNIRYQKCCRALMKFAEVFLIELGMDKMVAQATGKTAATLIEWDTAYSLRILDLATVTTKELLLENPRREFRKILEALADRDPTRFDLNNKFKTIFTIASWALYIPKYRRAFNRALEAIDFTMMQADEADVYHTLTMVDYKFGGRPAGERLLEYLRIHENNPPQLVIVNNATVSSGKPV